MRRIANAHMKAEWRQGISSPPFFLSFFHPLQPCHNCQSSAQRSYFVIPSPSHTEWLASGPPPPTTWVGQRPGAEGAGNFFLAVFQRKVGTKCLLMDAPPKKNRSSLSPKPWLIFWGFGKIWSKTKLLRFWPTWGSDWFFSPFFQSVLAFLIF